MNRSSKIKFGHSFEAAVRVLTFDRRIHPFFYVLIILGAFVLVQSLSAKMAHQPMPSMKPLADALITGKPPEAALLVDALRYFQRIAKTSSDQANAHAAAAYCLYYLNQRPQAVDELKKAVQIHPYFFWFYYNLGMVYYEMGDFRQAADAFEGALEVRLETTSLHISLSEVYQDILSNLPPDSYSPIAGLRQAYRDVYFFLMFSYYQLKDLETMMQVATVAGQEYASDGEFFYYAGIAAYEQGLPQEALASFERCLQLNPNDTRAMVYVAAVLQRLGKFELAGKILIRARLINGLETLPPVLPPEVLPLRIL